MVLPASNTEEEVRPKPERVGLFLYRACARVQASVLDKLDVTGMNFPSIGQTLQKLPTFKKSCHFCQNVCYNGFASPDWPRG